MFAGPATQARTAPDGLTDVSPAATDGSNSAVGASAVKIVTIGSLVQPKIAGAACEFSGRTVQCSVQSLAGVSMTESLVPWMEMRTTSNLAMASCNAVSSAGASTRVAKALVAGVQQRLTLPSVLRG